MLRRRGEMGTFAGVFTPSILTLLAFILFLRLGYVVGGVGLGLALLIIALAFLICILTSLSVAAIATNLEVRAGGDYYLISRTLGLSFGGAIGLVMFIAQSVSVGFYCMGFAEAVAGWFPGMPLWFTQAVAAAAILALFALAWLGADWSTRFQFAVMAILVAALLSFLVGGIDHWSTGQLAENMVQPSVALPFWVAFAIFFPTVTGFSQGVSMSGELADPARSIPLGTFAAVGLSLVVYLGAAVMLAASLPNATLAAQYDAMKLVSAWGPLIDAGVIATTLSAALTAFLVGPRILQALARDRAFPLLTIFAAGHGRTDNPRRAVALALAIALVVVSLGNLNLVASIVAMFFLLSYGLLNYATYFEARTESASFRPTFRWHHPWLSFTGAALCLAAMLAIDITAGLIAASILFAIYHYLESRAVPARWADSRRSHHLHQVRENLVAAAREPDHPRYWRPQVLVFSETPAQRADLLRFAAWIEGGIGLTTAAHLIQGRGEAMIAQREAALDALRAEIRELGVDALPLVVVAPDLDQAAATIVQSAGMGPARVNTVVAGWQDGPGFVRSLGSDRFGRSLRTAFRLGCNLLLVDAAADGWSRIDHRPTAERLIDVWWTEGPGGELMLLLAHLMTRSDAWGDARIRVLATGQDDPEELRKALAQRLEEFRIEADIEVVAEPDAARVVEVSREAAIAFLPLALQAGSFVSGTGNLDDLIGRLPLAVFTVAAQDVDLSADPDEGELSDIAAIRDRLEEADALFEQLAESRERAAAALAEAHRGLAEADGSAAADVAAAKRRIADAEAAVEKARLAAERAGALRDRFRRAADDGSTGRS